MQHDAHLLDQLSALATIPFEGLVYRATRRGLDPLATSYAGGRWMVPDVYPALYTSCERDGALAEISYHWSLLTPEPSKPVVLYTLDLRVTKLLKLGRSELSRLGVDLAKYGHRPSSVTQRIGAAAAFLELEGLVVPSARWNCDNITLFMNNHGTDDTMVSVNSFDEVEWRAWRDTHVPREKDA